MRCRCPALSVAKDAVDQEISILMKIYSLQLLLTFVDIFLLCVCWDVLTCQVNPADVLGGLVCHTGGCLLGCRVCIL